MRLHSHSTSMAGLIGILFAIDAVALFWRAFVLKTLWGWFVSPLFSVSQLGMAAAIGLMALMMSLKSKSNADGDDSIATIIASAIVYPLFALVIGWLARSAL